MAVPVTPTGALGPVPKEGTVPTDEQRAAVARTLQRSRETLDRASEEAEQIQRDLERSRSVRARALPALRRAGLLR